MTNWKLVPVEPTVEMLEAMKVNAHSIPRVAAIRYRDMLAAAPSPEWVPVSERLPTREDADEASNVWLALNRDGEITVRLFPDDLVARGCYPDGVEVYWMPKPRVEPPAPPE